jgi:hypothetical protein
MSNFFIPANPSVKDWTKKWVSLNTVNQKTFDSITISQVHGNTVRIQLDDPGTKGGPEGRKFQLEIPPLSIDTTLDISKGKLRLEETFAVLNMISLSPDEVTLTLVDEVNTENPAAPFTKLRYHRGIAGHAPLGTTFDLIPDPPR